MDYGGVRRLSIKAECTCFLFVLFFLGFVGPKPMLGMEMAYLFGRAPGKLEWECSKWGKFSRSRVVNLTMKFLEVGCWTFMDFWILLVSSETVSWRSQAQGLRSLTEILEGQVVGRIPGDPASAVASCEPGQLTEETPPPPHHNHQQPHPIPAKMLSFSPCRLLHSAAAYFPATSRSLSVGPWGPCFAMMASASVSKSAHWAQIPSNQPGLRIRKEK